MGWQGEHILLIPRILSKYIPVKFYLKISRMRDKEGNLFIFA